MADPCRMISENVFGLILKRSAAVWQCWNIKVLDCKFNRY